MTLKNFNKQIMVLSVLVLCATTFCAFQKKSDNQKEKNMNVYAIFANDNTSGMSQALFTTAVDTLKNSGRNVDILNLYDRASEMPFFKHDRAYLESFPWYMENQQRFLKADTLLIVFPVYWYSVPAILKNWLDLLHGWSYQYESGQYAKATHNVKKVIIFYCCAQPQPQDGSMSMVEQQLLETFKFIGIDDVQMHGVDNVYGLIPEKAAEHFDTVKKICQGC